MSKIRLFGTSSGYVEIAPAAAASNNTLTAPSTVGENIAKDAAGAIGITSMKASNVNVGAAVTITESGIEASGIGITCANINGTQIGGRRNLIINGGMTIAQRGTSSTSSGYVVDRFRPHWNGTDESPTQAQVTLTNAVGPYLEGHRKSLRITNGNQTTSPAVDDYIIIETKVEAQDIASSGWNYTSTSSFITLSFWVKSSVSFNMKGYFFHHDGTTQSYPLETGTLTANTWTKIVRTIPGNSNVEFDNNTDVGLTISFGIYGSTFSSANSPVNQWVTYSSATLTNPSETTWYTTNDATLEFTGLQLEVGDTATSFEHRSYQDELLRCQRYYYAHKGPLWGQTSAGDHLDLALYFPVPMRATPSFNQVDTSILFKNRLNQGNSISANTYTISGGMSQYGAMWIARPASGESWDTADGRIYYYHIPEGTTSYEFTSEL